VESKGVSSQGCHDNRYSIPRIIVTVIAGHSEQLPALRHCIGALWKPNIGCGMRAFNVLVADGCRWTLTGLLCLGGSAQLVRAPFPYSIQGVLVVCTTSRWVDRDGRIIDNAIPDYFHLVVGAPRIGPRVCVDVWVSTHRAIMDVGSMAWTADWMITRESRKARCNCLPSGRRGVRTY
jgi:hypothetical protein